MKLSSVDFSDFTCRSVIPLAIVGAHRFYAALTNFLGLIGYWASCFITVVVIEHLLFRKYADRIVPPRIPQSSDEKASNGTPRQPYSTNAFLNYDLSAWATPTALPSGLAAVGASVLSFGLIIPCMDQVWFVGPIAKTTGDIGFEVAFVMAAVLYVPLRLLEVRMRRRL